MELTDIIQKLKFELSCIIGFRRITSRKLIESAKTDRDLLKFHLAITKRINQLQFAIYKLQN